ncbi:MAG: hypothetical protein HC904_03165 [Blastochloris sp.]|nr:hypothetical protein [Blastochloris sp.]
MNLGETLKKKGFFFVGNVHRIELGAVVLIEESDDVSGGGSAELIEVIFIKMEGGACFLKGFQPGFVVEGHGVGQGAVAVENVAGKGSGREFKSHKDEDRKAAERGGVKIGKGRRPTLCISLNSGIDSDRSISSVVIVKRLFTVLYDI